VKTENHFPDNIYAIATKFLVLIIFCFFLFSCVRSHTKPVFPENGGKLLSETAVDVNKASLAELEKLPFVGVSNARKIIEHREKYGKFRRVEHLLLIEGINDRKFRQIREQIKVE
jgi:competence ComEA-like helix-hairpin-helix protein